MPLPIDPTCLSCGASNLPNASHCRVCGAPFEVSAFLPAKTRVGHFEIEKVLGRGGFGITYKARDVTSGTTVALKELMPEGMASRGANGAVNIKASQVAAFEEVKTKFIAEAQLLRKITDAASAKFVDLVAQNQTLYLAMDFVEGVTLESRIASKSFLSVKETRSILRDVLGVLEEMHLLNILHRDIKPANIILQPGGAKLIDFGSGLHFQKNKTIRVTSRVLTPAYAPLELYGQNIRLSAAADLYSLAATMYEAMTGVRIPSALERANGQKLQALSNLEPSAPEGLVKAIEKALEVRVDARPQSVREFRDLLDAPSQDSGVVQSATSVGKQKPVKTRTKKWKRNAALRANSSVGVYQASLLNPSIQTSRPVSFDIQIADYTVTPFLFLFFSTFALVFLLRFIGLAEHSVNQILTWLVFSVVFAPVQVPLGWLLVLPVRMVFDLLSSGSSSKYLRMGFYRQSMLGLYCFGAALFFAMIVRGGIQNIDLQGLCFAYFLPGCLFAVIALAIGMYVELSKAQPTVHPIKIPFKGLHLIIPALIGGWYLDQYSQASQSIKPAPSSQTSTTSGMASTVQAPTSSSVVAFANVKISGSKQVCRKHLVDAWFTQAADGKRFLIPLDDESFEVSSAIAPRLNAVTATCWGTGNEFQKFNKYQLDEFIGRFHNSFSHGEYLVVTAKPIEVAQGFLGRVAYKKSNVVFVSTDMLRPTNYKSNSDAKNIFLERLVTVIYQQQSQDQPNIQSLEDLDKLWRK
jgi:serine/threonine protein kinase